MRLFKVSKKNSSLSVAEAKALYGSAVKKEVDSLLFIDTTKNLHQNLAYTKNVYEILFSCPLKDIFPVASKYNWQKIIENKTYAIRSSEKNIQEKEIADIIWASLKKPHVSLKNPEKSIHFFLLQKKVYATLRLWKNPNTFLHRTPHLRKEFYPASLDPQLALAMVNLTGSIKGTIVDPFCGTGGILIEGALSGRTMFGFDISAWMLEKCRKNLQQYSLSVPLQQGDATTFCKKCAAIVTELPFGKNTRSQDLETLYTEFLENAKNSTAIIVAGFPDFVEYKKIIKKIGWKIEHDFSWYLHKSLTKHVVVLRM